MTEQRRRTKILATLGPATDAPGVLDALLRAGVDVVRLNFSHGDPSAQIARAEAVRAAAAELLAAATPEDAATGVLVAPMVRGARELIAGLVVDPQFGRAVMLGVGGVLAEAVADVVFRLVPITALDAAEMIEDLAAQKLLGPFRGEPAVDRDALVAVLVGLSGLAEARPDVVAVDVNPLIVHDGHPIAVDGLVEIST